MLTLFLVSYLAARFLAYCLSKQEEELLASCLPTFYYPQIDFTRPDFFQQEVEWLVSITHYGCTYKMKKHNEMSMHLFLNTDQKQVTEVQYFSLSNEFIVH